LEKFSVEGALAILQEFGSLEAAWNASSDALMAARDETNLAITIADVREKVDMARFEQIITQSDEEDVKIIPAIDPAYPILLSRIKKPPHTLFALGNIEAIKEPSIAIVGPRSPSSYGEEKATELAENLSREGFVIVSGLAQGVDTCAHKGALKARGKTTAVLASGVCSPTPPRNRSLALSILEQNGTLLSEYGLYNPPARYTFVQRNRIIAGLAQAVIVIEGKKKSGSRHTAESALKAGIKVFYLKPEDSSSELSELPRQLEAKGGTGIEEANDVIQVLKQQESEKEYDQTRLV
jgi:DNA processing protein